jgi:hypothetical protein
MDATSSTSHSINETIHEDVDMSCMDIHSSSSSRGGGRSVQSCFINSSANTTKNDINKNNKRPRPPPALEPISDESSLDDSMNSRSKGAKKRVSWDKIHTREYALVVGDHPMCQDGLPVSLGWQYNDGYTRNLLQIQFQQKLQHQLLPLSERRQSYVFPRRLSYQERRDRLVAVSNLTLDQIKNDEIDLVVRTLKESWEDVQEEEPETATDNTSANLNFMMDQDDPLADMMVLDDVPGFDIGDLVNADLGDISNFEWTDEEETTTTGPNVTTS